MRVITGSRRGKKLKTLEALDTRPTTDMVKEAVFSAIQFDVAGSQVLDLFAGSGQMGIEALSRDAAHCVFVDNNPAAVQIIKENISDCKFVAESRVLNMDSLDYLKVAKGQFDIVLLDPPYGKGLIEKALVGLDAHLSDRAIVVCEHEKELELGDEYGKLVKHKRYKYGKIAVTIFKIPTEEE
ncbi:16S rRNA (guanine(966)-N(2))-methyltransferase RsmD [uncultured Ruminococcus sp.]|uniref:16S rRNA (guanine(966)-N(2))-methyltransferase RsmD n=1 Tax=uncultured Ruminococcus sp. TaxID=165186 RepID=UPI000ED7080D|nr:16S rRNA (guanine(966)-N(2))-methyltransferase RsmD [uncultured Ruminococcus sp.]HCJ40972.1 16S rRNA (guanine(966)-N(2))-methyltransferase RsmD [Ruminococcus sp.]